MRHNIRSRQKYLIIAAIALFLAGCAEIDLFKAPQEIIKHPLGTDPIHLGMTKEKIESLWGRPDQINPLGMADQWGTPKEEWVYDGRYSKIPIDKGYLHKSKYLYFEGNYLTKFRDSPEPREEKPKEQ